MSMTTMGLAFVSLSIPSHILSMSHRFQMIRISTTPIGTQVIQLQTLRNGTNHQFIQHSMDATAFS